MSPMRKFQNSWQGALAPALLLPLLVMLSPNLELVAGLLRDRE